MPADTIRIRGYLYTKYPFKNIKFTTNKLFYCLVYKFNIMNLCHHRRNIYVIYPSSDSKTPSVCFFDIKTSLSDIYLLYSNLHINRIYTVYYVYLYGTHRIHDLAFYFSTIGIVEYNIHFK